MTLQALQQSPPFLERQSLTLGIVQDPPTQQAELREW
ncbi:hypothetical protein CYA_2526 [Synechococcus sp. JA-3-3Ab]|nr:hypothetical protein CYA_2526 [Synechococcus sp. JA-3-3Ab]